MSSVKLQGNAGGTGSFTIASPSSSNTQTLTLPDATATLVGDTATQTLTNKTLTSPTLDSPTINTPTMGGTTITAATAVASTSGTSIDFTGIPSWVRRITLVMSGVSTSGTSQLLLQLGDSGGIETTGYLSTGFSTSSGGAGSVSSTAGFIIGNGHAATYTLHGQFVFTTIGNNLTWVCTGGAYAASTYTGQTTGGKTLSATLDRIRITTVTGTDTFDAGSINILYE